MFCPLDGWGFEFIQEKHSGVKSLFAEDFKLVYFQFTGTCGSVEGLPSGLIIDNEVPKVIL